MLTIQTAFGVAAFIVGLFTPLSPEWREAWIAIALLYLAGVWVFEYRALVAAGARRILPERALVLFQREDPFIPLAQAARELYEANLNQPLGRIVRGSTDGSEAEILDWLAYWISQRMVDVHGRRAVSTVFEVIPPERFHAGGVRDGAQRIERDGFDNFTDLSVHRDAFRTMIPALSDAGFPPGA